MISTMMEKQNKQLLYALLADDVHTFSSLLDKAISFSDYRLLSEAIKFNRKSIVYHLLDKGCCVYKPDNGTLPLHSALEKLSQVSGWTNVVLKLLYAGARVSDEDAKGNTALHVAFANEVHDLMMEFLVKVYLEESGEDVVNADGVSVLHVACASSRVEFVRQLLEMKADVNRQVPNRADLRFPGYTPLHFAVYYGNHKVAELLLKRGARIYEDDFNRATPLHLACYRRDTRMIDLILTHDRVTANVVDGNGLSHFMVACTSSEPAFAEEQLRVADCRPWTSSKTLINSRIKKNIVDCPFAGYTPLHFAADFGRVEVLRMLLIRGADCCATTAQSLTPLMTAYKRGHKDIARILSAFCVGYRMYEEVVLKVKDGAEKGGKDVSVCVVNKRKAVSDEDEVCLVDSSRESDCRKVSASKRTIRIVCQSACCKAVNGKRSRIKIRANR